MDSPQAKTIGMMGRDNLEGGMLFPFDSVGDRSFWMKDCVIPLDIIFIVGNKINKISKDLPLHTSFVTRVLPTNVLPS